MRIAVIGYVDAGVAEATKCTGDPVVAPGAGEAIVTPAKAEEAAHSTTSATSKTCTRVLAFSPSCFKSSPHEVLVS
jgi:hypothetical protein